jgi:hypothetical protein
VISERRSAGPDTSGAAQALESRECVLLELLKKPDLLDPARLGSRIPSIGQGWGHTWSWPSCGRSKTSPDDAPVRLCGFWMLEGVRASVDADLDRLHALLAQPALDRLQGVNQVTILSRSGPDLDLAVGADRDTLAAEETGKPNDEILRTFEVACQDPNHHRDLHPLLWLETGLSLC